MISRLIKFLFPKDLPFLLRPDGFDARELSWEELREQLNILNKMERGFASENVTEILKRVMDRLDEVEARHDLSL